jgi:hypothetical protein
MLRIYGLVLLAGAVSAVVYCSCRPRFDLSTPQKALDTFKRAMDGRRWSEAERCLSDACREHYAAPLADRRIFDLYSPYGYETEFGKLVPDWRVSSVEATGGRARARVSSGLPVIGGEQLGFWLELERGPDGLWRVDGPREDFEAWYARVIPGPARGWGAQNERR